MTTALLQLDTDHQLIRLCAPDRDRPLALSSVRFVLEFERRRFADQRIARVKPSLNGVRLHGTITGTALTFEVCWRALPHGWFRKSIIVHGRPDPVWGRFLRFHVVSDRAPWGRYDDRMGWREWQAQAAGLQARGIEEGVGRLPPFGYPVFGARFFAGLEHPMGINRVRAGRLELLHHPHWRGDRLESFPAVIGFARKGEDAPSAFQRYLAGIRLPPPTRALVEINTFWTDFVTESPGATPTDIYRTDLASYRRFITEWSDRVLAGERGLVSTVLLDAGWQNVRSLFEPKRSAGGPGDQGLAQLSRLLVRRGMRLGLWWSLHGPVGVDNRWAEQQGYRISKGGDGAAYSSCKGRLRYACLTDPRWEEAMGRRMTELLDGIPVRFFKIDWDNEGAIDPALTPHRLPLREQMQEANVNAMIRLFRRFTAHRRRPGVRGGWWLSPWWLPHVHNMHLPNSGDSEAADVPGLTQCDALITSRDTVLHHNMVTCRSPVPWDMISHHEFANAPRNAVQITDEAWLHNLIVWISRGSHYLQIYMPPYALHGWQAWTLREVLRWFRRHEDLLWRGNMRMVGGAPGKGEVYGFFHAQGARQILILRNPVAFPQQSPAPRQLGLEAGDWTRVFPCWESWSWKEAWMPSQAVWVLVRGVDDWKTRDARLRGENGWLVPFGSASLQMRHGVPQDIPQIQRFPAPQVTVERPYVHSWILHTGIPQGMVRAEWVLRFRIRKGFLPRMRAAVGRYSDGLSSAPVPIMWFQSHWRVGYGQGRMGMKPYDPQLVIARIAAPVGGEAHLSLQSDPPSPALVQGWLEAEEISLPRSSRPSPRLHLIPPSQPHRKRVLVAFQ
ncbi:MAG: hypothetical protein HY360_08615 [Verrucomicrobia bacterium]|nr:hypothetical protein [Verrucomicrobiota bacterium]